MTRAAGCAAAFVAVVAVVGVARAEPSRRAAPVTSVAAATPSDEAPDPAVEEAADANLQSIEARSGLTFDASVGGGLIFGIGIKDSVGRGPAVSLRLGHVANRHTVITFELTTTAALHKPATTSGTEANTSANLLAGARTYVNPSLWIRGAGGLGVYQARAVLVEGKLDNVTLVGPAVLGGVGVDVARFKWAVLSVDFATSAMLNRDGLLVASGLNFGLSFD